MGDKIEAFCKEREAFHDVVFLWEKPEILDIGGAVHNLAAKIKYQGRLLVLNADQFFYFSQDAFLKTIENYKQHPVILFNYWVNSSEGYNALEVDNKRMVTGLIKNKDLPPDSRIETYTGISLIDLGQLEKISGQSPFFESVAPWHKKAVAAVLLETDYWDFGTVKRYWESCYRILKTYRANSNHPFLRFLVQERALKTWKINLQNESYHALSRQVINLAPDQLTTAAAPMIVLTKSSINAQKSGIWWNTLFEEIKS